MTYKIQIATVLWLLGFSSLSFAEYMSWERIHQIFKSQKLNTKALSHIRCFFDTHDNSIFQKNISSHFDDNRCGGESQMALDSKRVFALIDYTVPSDQKRMFLVDRLTGAISAMAVAHGRFEAGMLNTSLRENKNSIKHARYFSNEIGSNAPSSGFYLSGIEYMGKFGRSMVLHGLEEGINDNACERAVVIHKHLMVTNTSAHILSSGCPMISRSYIDHVINILKAPIPDNFSRAKRGSVVFIYGPRESAWPSGTCDGAFAL